MKKKAFIPLICEKSFWEFRQPDGQEVEVRVRIIQPKEKWGEGILRTAGALADDPEWDAIMEKIHQERKGGKQ